MYRVLFSLYLAAILVTSNAAAETPAHLYDEESFDAKIEFVRNLRKCYPILAIEFTDMMMNSANGNLPPILKYERALSLLAVAKSQSPKDRTKNLDEAQLIFGALIESNPNSPFKEQVRDDLMRLLNIRK